MANQRGFSLLEVVVSVAILSLLLLAVLPLFPQSMAWVKMAESEAVSGHLVARVAYDLQSDPTPLMLGDLLAGERVYATADGSLAAYPAYGHPVRVTATPAVEPGLYQLHIEILTPANKPSAESYVYVGGTP